MSCHARHKVSDPVDDDDDVDGGEEGGCGGINGWLLLLFLTPLLLLTLLVLLLLPLRSLPKRRPSTVDGACNQLRSNCFHTLNRVAFD